MLTQGSAPAYSRGCKRCPRGGRGGSQEVGGGLAGAPPPLWGGLVEARPLPPMHGAASPPTPRHPPTPGPPPLEVPGGATQEPPPTREPPQPPPPQPPCHPDSKDAPDTRWVWEARVGVGRVGGGRVGGRAAGAGWAGVAGGRAAGGRAAGFLGFHPEKNPNLNPKKPLPCRSSALHRRGSSRIGHPRCAVDCTV